MSFNAIVLAGSRGGEDPLAAYTGVTDKALVEVGGRTMLARVVDALRAAGAGRVLVVHSSHDVRTHALMLGAEVLHVESTARPDGTRLLAGLRFSEPNWWERSGIFSGLNTNKKSVTLDLSNERGRELLGKFFFNF